MAELIPCVELPKIPQIPKIPLLGGAELRAFIDSSLGPPSDCRLTFNLLIQLAPYLGNLACFIKLMNVIAKLKDFVTAVPDPVKLGKAVPDLVSAIEEVTKCIPIFAIPNLLAMIKAILLLILSFLRCLVQQIQSVLKFQATLDLSGADDNDALRGILECAKKNADTTMDSVKKSVEPLEPIFQMISILADIAGHPIEIPDLSAISAGVDASATLQPLMDTITGLEAIVEAIPG
jgi:hypothetical protein